MNMKYKIIAGILFSILILANLIIAPDTNKKNVNGNIAVISDSDNNKLATIILEENSYFCSEICYAIWNISSNSDKENFLDFVEFEDLHTTKKKNLDYRFEYIQKYDDLIVEDFETVCEISLNSSEICHESKTGEHIVQIPVWKKFNPKKKFNGDYIIKLTGYKKAGEDIDWKPTFFGVKIDEWATWEDSFNVGLEGYWKLDENQGTISNDSFGINNLTGLTNTQWVVGRINSGYAAIATGEDGIKTNLSMNRDSTWDGFTLNFWFNSTAGFAGVISSNAQTNELMGSYILGMGNTVDLDLVIQTNGDSDRIGGYYNFVEGGWEMITVILNSTSAVLYSNGVAKLEEHNKVWSFNSHNITFFDKDSLDSVTTGANFVFDEIGIWNRSLSHAELSDLYNTGLGLSYISTAFPSVVIITPENITYNINNIAVNFTSDDWDSLWFYNGTDNVTYINNTWQEQNLSEGSHTFRFYANDSSGNLNDTEQVTFTIEVLSDIIIRTPINKTYNLEDGVNLDFNITSDDDLSHCNFTLDNWINYYNMTSFNSSFVSYTINNLTSNNYTAKFICNDTANNMNNTEQITFIFDMINPNNTIISPTGTISILTNISLNISDNTTGDNFGISYCNYTITTSLGASIGIDAVEIINCANTSFDVSTDGNYIVHVQVNDTSGNTNITTQSFTVDTSVIPPAPPGVGGNARITVKEAGEALWAMSTETGSGKYEFRMAKESSRTKDLIFENLGEESQTITLSCDGDLCDYIEFDETQFTLPLGLEIKTAVQFTIELPEDIKPDTYITNIIATDRAKRQGILTVEVDVGTFGFITELFIKLVSSKKIGQINFPYLLIIMFMWVSLGVGSYYLYLNKLPAGAAISTIGTGLISLIIIMFI